MSEKYKTILLIIVSNVLFIASVAYFELFHGVSKDIWVERMKSKAASGICKYYASEKEIAQILKENNITYEKCISLVSPSFNECLIKYYPSLPNRLNAFNAGKWGGEIGGCTGENFYDGYLAANDRGMDYLEGRGVSQNSTEAVKWFRKAAELGNPQGQYNLGSSYHYGRGIAQNDTEAVKWTQKAAKQGLPEAQFLLGTLYGLGVGGLAQSDKEAIKWVSKAAEQGYPEAQFVLGSAYQEGVGVVQSKTEALKWYRKAEAQGYSKAKEGINAFDHGSKLENNEGGITTNDSDNKVSNLSELPKPVKQALITDFANFERSEDILSSNYYKIGTNAKSYWY